MYVLLFCKKAAFFRLTIWIFWVSTSAWQQLQVCQVKTNENHHNYWVSPKVKSVTRRRSSGELGGGETVGLLRPAASLATEERRCRHTSWCPYNYSVLDFGKCFFCCWALDDSSDVQFCSMILFLAVNIITGELEPLPPPETSRKRISKSKMTSKWKGGGHVLFCVNSMKQDNWLHAASFLPTKANTCLRYGGWF